VVGGLGSLLGAFIASLMIGLIQTFAVSLNVSLADAFGLVGITLGPDNFLSDIWQVPVAQVAPVIPYLLLVLVLVFRPTGLMGTRDT
jgi:branched-chain amino acid transport system permease protein